MSQETKQKKKPKIWIREWKIEPGEWREATEEEIKELIEEPYKELVKFQEKMRRFFRKIEEAFNELFS